MTKSYQQLLARLLLFSFFLESCYNPHLGMNKLALPEASYQEAGPDEASLRGGTYNQGTFPEQVAVTKSATQPIRTSQHPDQDLARTSPHHTLLSQSGDNSVAKYHHHVPETSQKALSTAPQLPPLAKQPGLGQEQPVQSFLSQAGHVGKLPIYPVGSGLLPTAPQVIPGGEHLPFQARGGEQVRFTCQMGQWRAQVLSQIGAFSRRAGLPVLCSQGEDVASSLEVLSKYPSRHSQHRIHVLGRKVIPTLGEVVYVGELGLKGGGQGQSSGSREPGGRALSNPTEQGDDEPSEQEMSSRARGKQSASGDVVPQAVSDAHLVAPSSAPGSSSSQLPSSSQIAQGAESSRAVESVATSSKGKVPHSARLTPDPGVSQVPSSAVAAGRQILTTSQPLASQKVKVSPALVNRPGASGAHLQGHKFTELFSKLKKKLLELKILKRPEGDAPLVKRLRELVRDPQVAKTPEKLIELGEVLLSLAESKQKEGASTQDLSHYTDRAILYQHVLSICDKEQDTLVSQTQKASALEKSSYQGLTQLQASMLAQAKGVDAEAITKADVASLQKHILQDRRELQAFRADVKPRAAKLVNNLEAVLSDPASSAEEIKSAEEVYIQGSQALFGEIKQWMSEFLSKLYQESEEVLGPAPCKYTVMGLGSMALQQITPYSDLEFAILMEDAKNKAQEAKWKEYFRKLTHLVHFRVINLGETIIPTSKYQINFNHLGKRGTNFDLGGKTPLGRKDKPYGLIQPVARMMYYLENKEDKQEHRDKRLPFILESTCHVYGNQGLYDEYEEKKRKFLLDEDDREVPAYQARALKNLIEGVVEMDYTNPWLAKPKPQPGDLKTFAPQFGLEDAGRLYDVKQEIYRLPDRLLYGLAMYHGILPTSGWDAVAQLADSGIIHPSAVHHLNYAVSFATMLRLSTYLHHGQQKEQATMLSDISQEEKVRQAVQAAFTLPQSSLIAGGSLFKYYYTALPLHRKMKKFFEELGSRPQVLAWMASNLKQADELAPWFGSGRKFPPSQERTFFQEEPFYDSSAETRGDIHQRLLQYKEAASCLEQVLSINKDQYGPEHLEVASILVDLGNVLHSLGQHTKAQVCLEEADQIQKRCYGAVHPEMIRTLVNLGVVYWDLGKYDEAQASYKQALPIIRKHYSAKHPKIAITLMNLGALYQDLGQYTKAQEYYKKAHEIQKHHYGTDHPEVALTLMNLGNVYHSLGQYGEVQKCLEKALDIQEQHYGPDHPEVARTLMNLGVIYYSLGRYKEAKERYEKTLKIKERNYGEDHPEVAKPLMNLGNVYYSLGQYRKAQEHYEKTLLIYKRHYREDHPEVARTLMNLGVIYYSLGQYKEAKEHYEKAHEIQKCYYGKDHLVVTETLVNLGNVHHSLGQYREAKECLEKAHEIQKRYYGKDHLVVTETLVNLGNVYYDLGQYHRAQELYKKAFPIVKNHYGGEHPGVATILMNLGNVCESLGQYREAREHLEKACKIQKRNYGEDHLEVAKILVNLGNVYYSLEQYDEAKEHLEKAYEIQKIQEHYETDHPGVAKTFAGLGNVYYSLGQYDEARERLEKAYEIQKRYYGEDHLEVAKALANLGNVYHGFGKDDEAKKHLEKALAVLEQYRGENHPVVARALMNLGNVYHSLGQCGEAKKRYEKALEIQEQRYGSDHPDVARTLVSLGNIYHSLGQRDEAKERYVKGLVILEQHYGPNHPDVARIRMGLGVIYLSSGQYVEAQSHLAKALVVQEQRYSSNHPDVAETLINLGKAHHSLGQYTEAQACLEKALEIQERHYGAGYPDIARTLASLGKIYQSSGQYAETQKHYKKALVILERAYGAEHPVVAKTLRDMLNPFFSAFVKAYKENDVKEAIHNLEEVLKTIDNAGSKDNRYENEMRLVYCKLACMYHVAVLSCSEEAHRQAYIDKAENNFKQAVCLRSNLGVGLSTIYGTYGNFLLATGDTVQAYDYLIQAITSGDDESGLEYELIDRPTATPILQARIDQDKEVKLKGIDYAYYLMIHHYEDFQEAGIQMAQTREAYLAAYQTSLDQRSSQAGQEQADKTAYYLLGSLYEAQGDHEAAATAFARSQR